MSVINKLSIVSCLKVLAHELTTRRGAEVRGKPAVIAARKQVEYAKANAMRAAQELQDALEAANAVEDAYDGEALTSRLAHRALNLIDLVTRGSRKDLENLLRNQQIERLGQAVRNYDQAIKVDEPCYFESVEEGKRIRRGVSWLHAPEAN